MRLRLDFDGGLRGAVQPPVATTLIVPGWRDSGPGHWQSLWAHRLSGAMRVVQDDWLHPSRTDWVDAIAGSILQAPGPVVIAAHSLGYIAVVHLQGECVKKIRGALLVAPAEPERRAVLEDFAPVPCARLPYRSIVVSSTDDPYCSSRRASAYARAWGSDYVRLQNVGHINLESGHGDWPLGLTLLRDLWIWGGSTL